MRGSISAWGSTCMTSAATRWRELTRDEMLTLLEQRINALTGCRWNLGVTMARLAGQR